MVTCYHCSATWGGTRTQHCSAPGCHETFTGTTSGDMHRVGEHHTSVGPNRRRCLTPAEMIDLGMGRNRFGYWMSPAEGPHFKGGVSSRSDEQGGGGATTPGGIPEASTQYGSEVG